jgi:hypothetical protein
MTSVIKNPSVPIKIELNDEDIKKKYITNIINLLHFYYLLKKNFIIEGQEEKKEPNENEFSKKKIGDLFEDWEVEDGNNKVKDVFIDYITNKQDRFKNTEITFVDNENDFNKAYKELNNNIVKILRKYIGIDKIHFIDIPDDNLQLKRFEFQGKDFKFNDIIINVLINEGVTKFLKIIINFRKILINIAKVYPKIKDEPLILTGINDIKTLYERLREYYINQLSETSVLIPYELNDKAQIAKQFELNLEHFNETSYEEMHSKYMSLLKKYQVYIREAQYISGESSIKGEKYSMLELPHRKKKLINLFYDTMFIINAKTRSENDISIALETVQNVIIVLNSIIDNSNYDEETHKEIYNYSIFVKFILKKLEEISVSYATEKLKGEFKKINILYESTFCMNVDELYNFITKNHPKYVTTDKKGAKKITKRNYIKLLYRINGFTHFEEDLNKKGEDILKMKIESIKDSDELKFNILHANFTDNVKFDPSVSEFDVKFETTGNSEINKIKKINGKQIKIDPNINELLLKNNLSLIIHQLKSIDTHNQKVHQSYVEITNATNDPVLKEKPIETFNKNIIDNLLEDLRFFFDKKKTNIPAYPIGLYIKNLETIYNTLDTNPGNIDNIKNKIDTYKENIKKEYIDTYREKNIQDKIKTINDILKARKGTIDVNTAFNDNTEKEIAKKKIEELLNNFNGNIFIFGTLLEGLEKLCNPLPVKGGAKIEERKQKKIKDIFNKYKTNQVLKKKKGMQKGGANSPFDVFNNLMVYPELYDAVRNIYKELPETYSRQMVEDYKNLLNSNDTTLKDVIELLEDYLLYTTSDKKNLMQIYESKFRDIFGNYVYMYYTFKILIPLYIILTLLAYQSTLKSELEKYRIENFNSIANIENNINVIKNEYYKIYRNYGDLIEEHDNATTYTDANFIDNFIKDILFSYSFRKNSSDEYTLINTSNVYGIDDSNLYKYYMFEGGPARDPNEPGSKTSHEYNDKIMNNIKDYNLSYNPSHKFLQLNVILIYIIMYIDTDDITETKYNELCLSDKNDKKPIRQLFIKNRERFKKHRNIQRYISETLREYIGDEFETLEDIYFDNVGTHSIYNFLGLIPSHSNNYYLNNFELYKYQNDDNTNFKKLIKLMIKHIESDNFRDFIENSDINNTGFYKIYIKDSKILNNERNREDVGSFKDKFNNENNIKLNDQMNKEDHYTDDTIYNIREYTDKIYLSNIILFQEFDKINLNLGIIIQQKKLPVDKILLNISMFIVIALIILMIIKKMAITEESYRNFIKVSKVNELFKYSEMDEKTFTNYIKTNEQQVVLDFNKVKMLKKNLVESHAELNKLKLELDLKFNINNKTSYNLKKVELEALASRVFELDKEIDDVYIDIIGTIFIIMFFTYFIYVTISLM